MATQVFMLVSTVVAGIVAGGAWAYTLEVHPAMLKARPESSIDLFTPMFKHANVMQPILGVCVLLSCIAIGFLGGTWLWAGGAVVMQLIGPYTIFGMMPLNRRLMDTNADPQSAEIGADLKRWGALHLVRTLVNTGVFVFFCTLVIWK